MVHESPSRNMLPLCRRVAVAAMTALLAASPIAVSAQSDESGSRSRAPAGEGVPLPTREQIMANEYLRNALSRSSEGLVEVRLPNGAVMVDLQGRFQMISAARLDAEGNVLHGCVHDHDSLADFLEAHPEPAGEATAGGSVQP